MARVLREQDFVHITVEVELDSEVCAAEHGHEMREKCGAENLQPEQMR